MKKFINTGNINSKLTVDLLATLALISAYLLYISYVAPSKEGAVLRVLLNFMFGLLTIATAYFPDKRKETWSVVAGHIILVGSHLLFALLTTLLAPTGRYMFIPLFFAFTGGLLIKLSPIDDSVQEANVVAFALTMLGGVITFLAISYRTASILWLFAILHLAVYFWDHLRNK